MQREIFDYRAFYATLDGVRGDRRLTWRQVAREARVSASSLTRMAQGSRADIETVGALAAWAAVSVSSFFDSLPEEDPLAMAAAYLHKDPKLTPQAADALERVVRATYSQLAPTDDVKRGRA